MADDTPEGLDQFLATAAPTDTPPVSGHPSPQPSASPDGAPAGLDEFIAPELQQAKYGTLGQQAIAGLEAVAQGVAGPLATGAERLLGVPAEDILGREQANPGTHLVGELAGFAGSAVLGTGQAALLGKAGEAMGAATGLGKAGSGFIEKFGADAIKAAFEGALYQGGSELATKFKEDPDQTAGSAIAHIGLAGVMTGVFGGALGAAMRKTGLVTEAAEAPGKFVSELDAPALAAGDFKAVIEHSDDLKPLEKTGILKGLGQRKQNADEVEKIADELGYPVLEGMISDHKLVQRAEDALINGGNTTAALKRQELYKGAYDKAAGDVEVALGEGSKLSKAQIGDDFKQTLVSQIKEENEPIKAMYEKLKMHNEHIPLNLNTGRIVQELEAMPEFRLSGSLPGGSLVKGAIEGISKSQTVDDLKVIRSAIGGSLGPTAAPSERRVAAIIGDKLKQLEEDSIEAFAKLVAKTPEDKAIAMGLNAARKEADAAYKPFIQKLQKLSKALGKENIGGTQGAIQFIENLTPEQVTQRLFTKNNSQFLKFFDKEFPEQAAQMRAYQKGLLREAATKEGVLSPKDLFNRINKLEPEIRQSIFSADELKTLGKVETYLRSFPKNFNPSGTAHTLNLLDSFGRAQDIIGGIASGNPLRLAAGVAGPGIRDKAIEKFITGVGATPRMQQAAELAKATLSGEKMADKGVKAILAGEKDVHPDLTPKDTHRSKLSKLVDSFKADPSKMLQAGDNNPIPEYAQAFSAAAARAVTYLSTLKPDTQPVNPLDTKHSASPMQQSVYNRALDIAEQPLHILKRIQSGTMTPQDIVTLKTVHPGVYKTLSQKIMTSVIEKVAKGETIPYATRLQLSMFLGQPLDSTMTQANMAAMQAANSMSASKQQPATAQAPASGPKRSMNGLAKLPTQNQTPGQARVADRSDGKL